MMKVSEKMLAARREEILSIASRLLGERARQTVSIRSIAKAVGFPDANFYRYYPSRAELMIALLRLSTRMILKEFDRIDDLLDIDSMERVAHYQEILSTFGAKEPGLARVLTGTALLDEPNTVWCEHQHCLKELMRRIQMQLELAQLHHEASTVENPAATALEIMDRSRARWLRSEQIVPLDGTEPGS